ncbi:hypothetical protein NQ315_003524 [Exocentrus adspersus]|uniref:DDE Tnp4 domain-containing protein n=1 Tax=Exocentrus adspersus TaxID=1586481 RepID=A0AAV8V5S9_9CUCU|nr:hypothetical protein NQ315_003524 [Exocentrus adspersus]
MEEILEAIIVADGEDPDVELAIFDNILIDRDGVEEFQRADLPRLQNVFRIPHVIVTEAGDRIEGFKALLIILKRLAYPCRLVELKKFFNMSSQSISQIVKSTCSIMLAQQGNLLEDLNRLEWLTREGIEAYAEAIYTKGGAINNCCGFIDGTARAMCRPSVDQQDYYSGHKKVHCLKYQSVICPDGIICSLIGAYPGRRHDAAIFRDSNLYQQLEQKAVFGNDKFVLFGDQGYGLLELLITPFPGAPDNMPAQHLQFNQSMQVLRVAVVTYFVGAAF